MDGWNTIVSLWEFAYVQVLCFRFILTWASFFFLAQDAEGILMKMMMCLKKQQGHRVQVGVCVHPEFVGK